MNNSSEQICLREDYKRVVWTIPEAFPSRGTDLENGARVVGQMTQVPMASICITAGSQNSLLM